MNKNIHLDQAGISINKDSAFSGTQVQPRRIPLPEGAVIPIFDTDIRIIRDGLQEEFSAGSSCLVYQGHIVSGTGLVPGMQVIIKEFYPVSTNIFFDIDRRPNGSLRISQDTRDSTAFKLFHEQFQQALYYQKALAGSNAMEISVRPLFVTEWGDTTYVISDAHRGIPAEKSQKNLRDTLSFSISFVEAMDILHENGYIMTDIKADNFLWIQRPCTVRIIDTDSLIPYREAAQLTQQPLYDNKNHWSPELAFLHTKFSEGTSDREMSMLRRVMLNPNADRYAMGLFLFELFFGRLPELSGRDAALKEYKLSLPANANTQFTEELNALYGDEIHAAGRQTTALMDPILHMLRRLLIHNPAERKKKGYHNDAEIVSDLLTVYAQFTSEKLVLRRETAKANARFAAYNLLEKFPLFKYPTDSSAASASNILPESYSDPVFDFAGSKCCVSNTGQAAELQAANHQELRVAIIGQHAMRPDMLSAVLSIGQMPDIPLHIELLSEDAEAFWQDYISAEHNPALARAVTWETLEQNPQRLISKNSVQNSQALIEEFPNPDLPMAEVVPCFPGIKPMEFDSDLVDRPLAHLTIRAQGTPSINNCYSPANYCILLEEDPENRKAWIRHIARLASRWNQNTFIGHLQFENDEDPALSEREARAVTLYAISTECFTENYSEKMFSEKIYEMGLMAHAYYCKAMEESFSGAPSVDMKNLEKQYRGDVYSITSSERCALHGAYKLAGLGIDRKLPGRIRHYFRQISKPDVLEELAWIEHLSWTAFMLTSGAVPVSMEEFDTYAYLGGNDWKDKSDPQHLRHPLLAASGRSACHNLQELKMTENVTQEIFDLLDPLDKVSVQITRWYAAHRDVYRKRYLEWFSLLYDLCNSWNYYSQSKKHVGSDDKLSSPDLMSLLRTSGVACIDRMGTTLKRQDPMFRRTWEESVSRILSRLRDAPIEAPEPEGIESLQRKIRDEIEKLIEKGRKEIMKPVFDSLDDRDFKQYDRDLAYAVIDIIA